MCLEIYGPAMELHSWWAWIATKTIYVRDLEKPKNIAVVDPNTTGAMLSVVFDQELAQLRDMIRRALGVGEPADVNLERTSNNYLASANVTAPSLSYSVANLDDEVVPLQGPLDYAGEVPLQALGDIGCGTVACSSYDAPKAVLSVLRKNGVSVTEQAGQADDHNTVTASRDVPVISDFSWSQVCGADHYGLFSGKKIAFDGGDAVFDGDETTFDGDDVAFRGAGAAFAGVTQFTNRTTSVFSASVKFDGDDVTFDVDDAIFDGGDTVFDGDDVAFTGLRARFAGVTQFMSRTTLATGKLKLDGDNADCMARVAYKMPFSCPLAARLPRHQGIRDGRHDRPQARRVCAARAGSATRRQIFGRRHDRRLLQEGRGGACSKFAKATVLAIPKPSMFVIESSGFGLNQSGAAGKIRRAGSCGSQFLPARRHPVRTGYHECQSGGAL